MVRRLPVLQTKQLRDAAAERPAWHWIIIGAGFVLTIWLPLLLISLWLSPLLVDAALDVADPSAAEHLLRRAKGTEKALWFLLTTGPMLLSFVIANLAAGALVGRFGGRAGPWEAAGAGALAAAGAGALAALGGGLADWPIVVGALLLMLLAGAATCAVGALFGVRKGSRPGVDQAPVRR